MEKVGACYRGMHHDQRLALTFRVVLVGMLNRLLFKEHTSTRVENVLSEKDTSSAALLLLQVRNIATIEIRKEPAPRKALRPPLCLGTTDKADISSLSSVGEESDSDDSWVVSPPRSKPRCRTVSCTSVDMMTDSVRSHNTTAPSLSSAKTKKLHPATESTKGGVKFVGTSVASNVSIRAVLRKKFSWKCFAELETYLIAHRATYLQYSSQLNYTQEQKRFNNSLTQGLLDLAAEQGYLLEGFTFASIRDRIRCYYKSFVQATKKNKKRKKSR
jgi:hypothetical protein